MRIRSIRVLGGPNYWSIRRHKLIQMRLDLEDLQERPTNTIPGFKERLQTLLPGLWEHQCSRGCYGGFLQRVEEGTLMGHVVEHVALELQTLAGMKVDFGRTRETSTPGTYNVVFEYQEAEAGRFAAKAAVYLCQALVDGEDYRRDLDLDIQELREIRENVRFGPSTQALLDEAALRGIPYLRLNKGSLVQLGYGVYQKRIEATTTEKTSIIAADLAANKRATKELLQDMGIPVPKGYTVRRRSELAATIEDVGGFPVVIKPLNANHGKGITVNITSLEAAEIAYDAASQYSDVVLVEQHLVGDDYRLLVINNKLVAVAKRIPAYVVGDGRSTIQELIDAVNRDPRRGFGHENVLTQISVDDMTLRILESKGYTLDTVLPEGEHCTLKSTANLSTGGIAVDCTDIIHPYNAFIAERAAQIIGLDVAGIDLICPDIAQPVNETGGGIVEVNASPGLRMHLAPSEGIPRNVAEPIIDMLFPPGSHTRIPILAVTGTNGKTTTTALTGHLLAQHRKRVGVAGNISPAALTALMDWQERGALPEVWVLELSSFQLETTFSLNCAAAAMLNLSDDHLDRYIDLKDYATAKARIFQGIGTQVLNRDDARSRSMAIPGRRLISFGLDAPGEAADFGLRVRHGQEWIVQGEQFLLPLAELPIIGRHNAANAMAALALCSASGFDAEALVPALKSFKGLPHRLEKIAEIAGVAYYDDSKGTNVGATVAALAGLGRLAVIILGGDGKGQNFAPLAAALAAHARGAVLIGRDAAKIRAALAGCGIPLLNAADMDEAVRLAAMHARPGDAVLLSPACASFDMYENYVHRAAAFAAAVRALEAGR